MGKNGLRCYNNGIDNAQLLYGFIQCVPLYPSDGTSVLIERRFCRAKHLGNSNAYKAGIAVQSVGGIFVAAQMDIICYRGTNYKRAG